MARVRISSDFGHNRIVVGLELSAFPTIPPSRTMNPERFLAVPVV